MNVKPIIAAGFLIFATVATPLYGQSTDWTGPGSNFFIPDNWTNGVPQQGVEVGFNLPGPYSVNIFGGAEAGDVNVSGGGEPIFVGTGDVCGLTFSFVDSEVSWNVDVTAFGDFRVGDQAGIDDSLLRIESDACVEVVGDMLVFGDSDVGVVGGELSTNNFLNIGTGPNAGSGRFDLQDDARLETNFVRIGQNASANYTFNLSGSSSWTSSSLLIVGDLGTGQLNVTESSCVNIDSSVIAARNPSGRGEICISDFGSEFVATGGMLIGEDAPSTLEVSNEGFLQVGDDLTIASGSTATFNAGTAEMTGDINVNDSTLLLENGSSVQVFGVVNIDNGNVTINSSDLDVDEIINSGCLMIEGTDVVELENVTNNQDIVIDTDTQMMDLTNDSSILVSANNCLTVNGECNATGLFAGPGAVTLLGDVFIGEGNQPQDFTVEGALQLKVVSVVHMRVSFPVSDRIVCNEINIAANSLPTLELEFNNAADFQNGQEIVLIETDEDFANEFINHPEGDTVQVGDFTFTTTYSGGDGNDLALIVSGGSDVLLGDVNQDGIVDLLDVGPFVEVLSGGGVFQAEADCNEDGVVDLLDVGPFVSILAG